MQNAAIIIISKNNNIQFSLKKSLKIKMERLAHELNDSRLDVSKALNKMESENLVILHRGLVEIPAFELLIM